MRTSICGGEDSSLGSSQANAISESKNLATKGPDRAMTDMNTSSATNSTDLLEQFKSVPDIRGRVLFAALAIISIFAPIASAGAFGISASVALADIWGAKAFLLPLLAILVLIAPVIPVLKSNMRLIDLVNGGAVAFAAFIIAKDMIEAVTQLGRSYGGIRGSDFGSLSPSWGMIFFAAFVIIGIMRGIKALKAQAPQPK